jgi:hypothetical protein
MILELAKLIKSEDNPPKTVRGAIQEACDMPLFFRMNDYLEKEDWDGIIQHYSDPDIIDNLSPRLRMFLALAFLRKERELESFQVACRTLPDLPPRAPDLCAQDKQNYDLWDHVLSANIQKAVNASTPPAANLLNQFKISAGRMSPVDLWIALLKRHLDCFPTGQASETLKCETAAQIDEILRVQRLIKQKVEETRNLVSNGQFDKARSVIRAIPDFPADLVQLKRSLLGQIQDVENQSRDIERQNVILESDIVARGISIDRICRIAADNGVNINNPFQMKGLLEAIIRQIGI